jgi:hypothetical protein
MTHPKRKEGAKQNDWDIEDLSFVAFSQYFFSTITTQVRTTDITSKKRPFKRTTS